ncbi:polymorphic toxin-type HINT domain-containing protein [Streptomyces polyrhachis]|uniref:Polymorphic toxin-type HINT domain-containing protein n=1 Tax=Streptomyces polyrhachis TaxID=1282885 RepID=A0ABW2GI18_9ACTN
MRTRFYTNRRIAVLVSAVMVGTLLQGAITSTPAQADDLPGIPASEKPLSGHGVKMKPRKRDGQPRVPEQQPKHIWPAPGSATVTLKGSGSAKEARARAGALPITVGAPAAKSKSAKREVFRGEATVRLHDRKTSRRAGVDGPLLSVIPTLGASSGDVQIAVDYSAFAQSYGGAWARRLQLVQLPACATTTPELNHCSTARPVASHNDPKTRTLTATSLNVQAADSGPLLTAGAPLVLAVTAGASSDQGDYAASPLAASATWSTNLSTGDFGWSYTMGVPGVPGGFSPKVGLSYSSGGVDGRTANTNNQSSWAGDGFNLWPGSIERSYKSCADDNVTSVNGTDPGDLCWAYDNATISFNGRAGELIPTGTANEFKIKGDDGTKVTRIFGSSTNVRANGDNDDEYWRVTTTDGTRYYFGYNRLQGWATDKETSDSAWTAPVYGDDANEPCHGSTFETSWCQQAWRWNLDLAIDVHGNAIAYYYDKESNYYARNLKAADETSYDRGGSLDRIEYGFKDTGIYSTKALAKVDFTSKERCLPESGVTCTASSIDTQSFYWYDTPWDLNCKSGVDCTKSASPSFWTRLRLTDVTTQVLKTDGTYAPVDSWTMNHRWGMADTDYQLLLDDVQHIGKADTATDVPLPKVTFEYDQRPNRPDVLGDDLAPFIKERLSTISDESGGQIDVAYSAAACNPDSPPTPQSNITRCFPVYAPKPGYADPQLQWFNKYVVDAVTRTDRTNSNAPDMVTRYTYLDGAAWHYDDDDGLTKEKHKTWSSYRGYGHVRVQTGGQDPVGMKSQSDHYFLRGMDGDRAAPSGGTKAVSVTDDNGNTIVDHDSAAGFEYKTENYSGPGGKILSKTLNTPWHYETAKRVRSWGTTTANLAGTLNSTAYTSLDGGAGTNWRNTYVSYGHENVAGRVTEVRDYGANTSATDSKCTRTTYADPGTATGTKWILDAVARVETVAVSCSVTPDRTKDVLSDTRTAYDGLAYGAVPTKGDATRIATLKSHDGTTATYLESGITYDSYARQTAATDLTGNVTATETTAPVRGDRTDGRTHTTAYSPATGFPTTVTVTTPPATVGNAATAQTQTTTLEPIRGLPVTEQDTNARKTETTYDALGRKLKVWLPNRNKTSDTPNHEYSYSTVADKPIAVGTTTLAGIGRQTTYTLYDGFLRPRQIQAPGPNGGMLVADTFYDERGLTAKSFAPYYATKAPSTGLFALDDALSVETQTWNTYDGLGRLTKSQQVEGNSDHGATLATTATSYGGDRVTVTPPTGATATTTLTDVRGQTTELWQYHGSTPTGTPDKTLYRYTPAGQLDQVTDPAGNQWSYSYDLRGNQTKSVDPDAGTSVSVYGDRSELISSTRQGDPATTADDKKITRIYDNLGRDLETRSGSATGTLLTKRVWDPLGYEGQLSSATRYVGSDAYTTTYGLYDTLYRPHRTTTTIPATTANGALAGSYQSTINYNMDGTVSSVGYPAAGALSAEVITPTYDEILRPKTLVGSGGLTYVTDTTYSLTGKPLQYTYQAAGSKLTQVTNTYEWGTQRLRNSRVDRQDVPGVDKSATYTYDEAGNITGISDVSRDGTDNQCFDYDYLGRLAEAWTQPTTACAGTPTSSALGGPAPYWLSYEYDLVGNRTSETAHDLTGNTAKDTKRTYTYPDPKAARPHTLTQVDTTGPSGAARDTYTYSAFGDTATRTLGGDTQTLTWDVEGHLTRVAAPDGAGGTKNTDYVYDADGNRLITHTATETTLYLGGTEIVLPKGSATPKATRYYDLGGGNQAIRTDDDKLSFLLGDHHATSELAINATDLTMQQRRSTPFGAPRGKAPTAWPGTKGFVGGTQDEDLNLTHLGARDYDPTTGRFISVDPLMDVVDPQQIHGYSYANNNPVSLSDPDGLRPIGMCEGAGGCGGVAEERGFDRTDEWFTMDGDGTWTQHTMKREANPRNDGSIVWSYTYTEGATKTVEYVTLSRGVTYPFVVPEGEHHLWRKSKELAKALVFDPASCANAVSWDCALETVSVLPYAKLAKLMKFKRLDKSGAAVTECLIKHSFVPGTDVLLADGTTKDIEEVKPGDKVVVTDLETGKTTTRKVAGAIVTEDDKEFVDLTVTTKDGDAALISTTTHPFWVVSENAWVDAGDLKPNMHLRTPDGMTVELKGIRYFQKRQRTHDLTVTDVHTYYVLAGNAPVLVHNSNCSRMDWATQTEVLRSASRGKGNFGLGSGTRADADDLGRAWVGEGYTVASDGKTLVSQDGLRQFRPPSNKPNSATTGYAPVQANFEQRYIPRGQWQSNGHLDITD